MINIFIKIISVFFYFLSNIKDKIKMKSLDRQQERQRWVEAKKQQKKKSLMNLNEWILFDFIYLPPGFEHKCSICKRKSNFSEPNFSDTWIQWRIWVHDNGLLKRKEENMHKRLFIFTLVVCRLLVMPFIKYVALLTVQ